MIRNSQKKLTGQITTIERHILEKQSQYPDATGALTGLMYDIALAGKLIASHTTQAGLAEIIGTTSQTNIHGEEVQKLDEAADKILFRLNDHTGRVAAMVSEEADDILSIPDKYPTGKYVLSYDPLDGSSNIDYNVSVGTIFAIHQRLSPEGERGTREDAMQPGSKIVAAGYILYGSSTMLVYSVGNGVYGFTLDPQIGEFLLSHPDIKLPAKPKYFSANLGYQRKWSPGVRKFTEWLQGEDGGPVLGLRYIGSMVADFHRTLLSGGVFYYPVNTQNAKRPSGKLRLLYEVNPLAFLMQEAGGYTSNGHQSVLEIQPTDLHHRTPVFMGNTELVKQAEKYIKEYDG